MRLIVTGTAGQVARSLLERAPAFGVELKAVGRPELDLSDPRSIEDGLARWPADVVVNAAAYTAVDRAEAEEELATRVNVPEQSDAVEDSENDEDETEAQ